MNPEDNPENLKTSTCALIMLSGKIGKETRIKELLSNRVDITLNDPDTPIQRHHGVLVVKLDAMPEGAESEEAVFIPFKKFLEEQAKILVPNLPPNQLRRTVKALLHPRVASPGQTVLKSLTNFRNRLTTRQRGGGS